MSNKQPRQSLLSCLRKVRHATPEQAQAEAERLAKATGEVFHTYYCAFCSHYHVGRPSKKEAC